MDKKLSYEELVSKVEKLEKANEELRFEAVKYKTLFDSLPYGISISDLDGNILEINSIAEQLLGVSKEECFQRTIDSQQWQVVRPDGTKMPHDEWPSALALKEDLSHTLNKIFSEEKQHCDKLPHQ